jgi:hypothetical protein
MQKLRYFCSFDVKMRLTSGPQTAASYNTRFEAHLC